MLVPGVLILEIVLRFICTVTTVFAPLIDLRRRLRSVLDVIGAVNRSGYSLARGLELTRQWEKVLRCGPMGLVTEERLRTVSGFGESLA